MGLLEKNGSAAEYEQPGNLVKYKVLEYNGIQLFEAQCLVLYMTDGYNATGHWTS